MMTWNSPLSIGLDVVFGVIPAIIFGFYSFIFSAMAFLALTSTSQIYLTNFTTLALGFLSLSSYLSIFYVTATRNKVRNKIICLFLLVFCIFYSAWTGIRFVSLQESWRTLALLGSISVILVAIKHIIMLTRA